MRPTPGTARGLSTLHQRVFGSLTTFDGLAAQLQQRFEYWAARLARLRAQLVKPLLVLLDPGLHQPSGIQNGA